MTGLDDAAKAFAEVFESLGCPYAIMGGLAVRLYALPRPTYDVDFTAAIARDALPALQKAVEVRGFTTPSPQNAGWVDQVHGMPVVKFQWYLGEQVVDVDVFLAETPFQRELIARRQRHPTDGWQGWFVTPEDLILLKLLANRPKDRGDIADTLFVQGRLDEAYLKEWAVTLGVADELAAALGERPK